MVYLTCFAKVLFRKSLLVYKRKPAPPKEAGPGRLRPSVDGNDRAGAIPVVAARILVIVRATGRHGEVPCDVQIGVLAVPPAIEVVVGPALVHIVLDGCRTRRLAGRGNSRRSACAAHEQCNRQDRRDKNLFHV